MENQKCGRCNCYWKPENTDVKPSGLYYKCCKKCRNKEKQRREDNRDELYGKLPRARGANFRATTLGGRRSAHEGVCAARRLIGQLSIRL